MATETARKKYRKAKNAAIYTKEKFAEVCLKKNKKGLWEYAPSERKERNYEETEEDRSTEV